MSKVKNKRKWWLILSTGLFIALLMWLVFDTVIWLFSFKVEKDLAGFGSILWSWNSGWCLLFSLGIAGVFVVYTLTRYNKRFGQKLFEPEKITNNDGYDAKWLDQEELEEKIIIQKDGVASTYSVWTIAGIQDVIDADKDEEYSYHLLACDRFCLKRELAKINRTSINGGKKADNLLGGATIVIGAGRSGKTKQVVKPTILKLINAYVGYVDENGQILKKEDEQNCQFKKWIDTRSSMIICDLKGDIFKMTSGFAKEKGFNILRFNTTNSKMSNSWNPLAEIWEIYYKEYLPNWQFVYHNSKKENFDIEEINKSKAIYQTAKGKIERKLDSIVNIICPITDKRNEFWDLRAQALIKLYFLIQLDYGVDKIEYNFYNLSTNGMNLQENLGIMIDQLPKWAITKQLGSQFIGGIMGERTSTSISDVKATTEKALTSFAMQEIKNLTTENEKSIDFKSFIEKPTIIYVSVDTATIDSANNRLAVLFLEALYAYLQDYLIETNQEYFKKPIHFIIDEFGNLPKMDFMLKMFALNQGQNIMPMLILQSATGQLKQTYGTNQKDTLFDNAQCFILTSGVNPEFASWLSQRSGSTIRENFNKTIADNGKVSQSQSKQRVKNVDVEEFTNIDVGREIILFPLGLKPCKLHYKSAEQLKWYSSVFEKYDRKSADIDYGKISYNELDFFTESLNPDIVNRWITKYKIQNKDSKRNQIAQELLTKVGTNFQIIDIPEKIIWMDQKYDEFGGYPCKALELIGVNITPIKIGIKNTQGANNNTPKTSNSELLSEKELQENQKQSYLQLMDKEFSDSTNITFHYKSLISLLGFQTLATVLQAFKNKQSFEYLFLKTKHHEKYGEYIELYSYKYEKSSSFQELLVKFSSIFEIDKIDITNAFYIHKLISLCLQCVANSEFGISFEKCNDEQKLSVFRLIADSFNLFLKEPDKLQNEYKFLTAFIEKNKSLKILSKNSFCKLYSIEK